MELLRALAVLAEPPGAETARLSSILDLPGVPSDVDYTDLFLLQLCPYASVYTGSEGQIGGEARNRVAGFWRALGLAVPTEPDHLAALLGLYAALVDEEEREVNDVRRDALRTARHALFWEHLASWLPIYLARVEELGSTPYAAWATLLEATLIDEARRIAPPAALPRHLQEAPALPAPEAEADEWLRALLSPVRAGIVLTAADLARGARDLGLGLRAGERRIVLRTLLEQDAAATLGWLAAEARRRVAALDLRPAPDGAVTRWWAARAAATADALATLRMEGTVNA